MPETITPPRKPSSPSSSSSSSPIAQNPSKIPPRVEARPETRRGTRDTDILPAESADEIDSGSPISARQRETEVVEAALKLLQERREAQAGREEEVRAVAEVRELRNSEIDSPLTPGTPAIDLLTHLHNQAERIVAERGIQITLPFRFKHPQPDDVIPYQVVEADGSAKELRDGEKIVLKRREEGSERVVKAKELRRL